jgi:hypothetical protein
MWSIIEPLHLIRYLLVWKVNRKMVRLPHCLPVDLSRVLGTLIAERLPTREAQPWRKALSKWDGYDDAPNPRSREGNKPRTGTGMPEPRKNSPVPQAAWPLETILFVYPGKQIYGQGELIFWELKLVGASADHGLFLEVILPAMEEASTTSDPRLRSGPNSLWGGFDIQSIYAARGLRWEPVASDGKLDLRQRVLPNQWAEGLTFTSDSERVFDQLSWLTGFDLAIQHESERARTTHAPTLPQILEALAARLIAFIPGKHLATANVWQFLSSDDQAALRGAMEQAAEFPVIRQQLEPVPKGWPGKWGGSQKFLIIPDPIVPYLELASILHIGWQTHFGCGTFILK